jgi:hypothetical protein
MKNLRLFTLLFVLFPVLLPAQFYVGMYHDFGKNRLQFREHFWTYYKFEGYTVYQYRGGEKIAEYTARQAKPIIRNIERKMGYTSSSHINFIVYNEPNEFKQSNVDFDSYESGTGGVTEVAAGNVYLKFNGDYNELHTQIERGVAEVMVNRMMYGDNWREVIKNAALLSVPAWYTNGLISYLAQPWNVDIDNRVKDGILFGYYKKFNHLREPDATYMGHAIWNYIAEAYGPEVIPNVLYMARVSRSVESGFIFILGVGLTDLIKDAMRYYKIEYEKDEQKTSLPETQSSKLRTRKHTEYYNISRSPDGSKLAYVQNKLGKFRVIIADMQTGKTKTMLRGGFKYDRLPDLQMPLLTWRPDNNALGVIREKKAEPELIIYDLEEKKKYKRPVFKVDRVLSASFDPSGTKILLSATQQDKCDIWEYKLTANTVTKITDDMYSDLDPRYINTNGDVVFSSNRPNDSLKASREYLPDGEQQLDLFYYSQREKSLMRITQTPKANERMPFQSSPGAVVYLSEENGIRNRFYAEIDSAISHVDTTIHYRYFAKTRPLTNYSRNIEEHQPDPISGRSIDLVFNKSRFRFMETDLEQTNKTEDLSTTSFKRIEDFQKIGENTDTKVRLNLSYSARPSEQTPIDSSGLIDIHNYSFGDEPIPKVTKPGTGQFADSTGATSGKKQQEGKEFSMPEQRNYKLNFAYTDIVSTMDFNFANQLYQPFNGGPYTNPGLGILMKVGILDMFQDYKIEGGVRYAFNNNNLELFGTLHDRSKRLDKRYTIKRQSLKYTSDVAVDKVLIYKGEYELTYPFTEALGLKTEFSYRYDRTVRASVSDASLTAPNDVVSQAGIKVQLIFDNTLPRGLNLMYGTKFKIWAERYQLTEDLSSDLNVIGLDFRKYQKIHRDFIWAFRTAASTSLGQRKLVYYMGAVDNWIILNPERQRFNRQTPIANDQNYTFQALASPMRGFIQNARNGNSFVVINNELRFPIFRYFARKPLKSDFIANFQLVPFADIGTAWNGTTPFSEDNEFNTITVVDGPVTVRRRNLRNPIIGAFGAGLRTKLMGYFLKFDLAYGVEDGLVQKPITHISFGFDF